MRAWPQPSPPPTVCGFPGVPGFLALPLSRAALALGEADHSSHSSLSAYYVGTAQLMLSIHGTLPTATWTSMMQMGKRKHKQLRTSLQPVRMGGLALGSATLWSCLCGGGEGAGACCCQGESRVAGEASHHPYPELSCQKTARGFGSAQKRLQGPPHSSQLPTPAPDTGHLPLSTGGPGLGAVSPSLAAPPPSLGSTSCPVK